MSREPRRSGISYIRNNNSRRATFFKRRVGLYKAAADLSTLTGARIAIVLQSENGKMSSFGTPSAGAIVNSFLSGAAQVDPFVNQVQKDKITLLQNELFKVEKEKAMEDKRTKANIARVKELGATSRKAKLVYSKVEDLNFEELSELLLDLSQVQREINDRLPPQQPSNQLEVGGSRDPLLRWLSSSPSHSKNPLPPRRLPWTHIHPSLHVSKSSLSLPQSSWPQATLLNQTILPTAQAPSMPLLQHGIMPQHPLMVNTQVQMFSSPNEAHQHNNNNSTQGVHINSNILQPSSQSSLMSMLQPSPSSLAQITFCNELPPPSLLQQPQTLFSPEPELHLVAQPENHASIGDFVAGHPFAIHRWPSPMQSDEPYFDACMD